MTTRIMQKNQSLRILLLTKQTGQSTNLDLDSPHSPTNSRGPSFAPNSPGRPIFEPFLCASFLFFPSVVEFRTE